MKGTGLYRLALRVLIGAVGISAVLGIYALLRRDLDEWSAKTLGTTLFVSAASLLIMANAVRFEGRSRGYKAVSGFGLLAAIVALPVFLYGLWSEVEDEALWKFGVSLEIVSIFAGHSSLLSLGRPPARYGWLLPLATALGASLTALIIGMVWAEKFESGAWRAAGILSILLLSVTIILPVISRLGAIDAPEVSAANAGKDRIGYCPNCGESVKASRGRGRCSRCGAGFSVKFDARS